jgi:hypothetical protein
MRGPLVPKTYSFRIASKIASRVFSTAQTPIKPLGFVAMPPVRG